MKVLFNWVSRVRWVRLGNIILPAKNLYISRLLRGWVRWVRYFLIKKKIYILYSTQGGYRGAGYTHKVEDLVILSYPSYPSINNGAITDVFAGKIGMNYLTRTYPILPELQEG